MSLRGAYLPPLRGWGDFRVGRGYQHGVPTELALNGAQPAIP
jgi:hypothetical protein